MVDHEQRSRGQRLDVLPELRAVLEHVHELVGVRQDVGTVAPEDAGIRVLVQEVALGVEVGDAKLGSYDAVREMPRPGRLADARITGNDPDAAEAACDLFEQGELRKRMRCWSILREQKHLLMIHGLISSTFPTGLACRASASSRVFTLV